MTYKRTKVYRMNDAQYKKMSAVCYVDGPWYLYPWNPQELVNQAWVKLGIEMGFKHETAKPIKGKSYRYFKAEPRKRRDE